MAKTKPTEQKSDDASPQFEQGLAELQQIVQQLENGQLGLDAALEKYQRGIEVLQQCHGVLKSTERKIELLSGVDAEGNPITRPFEEGESSTLEEKAQSRAKRRGASKKSASKTDPDNVDDERKLF